MLQWFMRFLEFAEFSELLFHLRKTLIVIEVYEESVATENPSPRS